MTPENNTGDDENESEDSPPELPGDKTREDYLREDPLWIDDAPGDRIVSYYTLSHTRAEIIEEIANIVGFETSGDRLNKDELAKTLVWMRAVTGEL